MKKFILFPLMLIGFIAIAQNSKKGKNFFELRVYEYKTEKQQSVIDQYLKDAFMPFMKGKGAQKIGVFSAITNDTASVKRMYVLIPYKNLNQIPGFHRGLMADQCHNGSPCLYQNDNISARRIQICTFTDDTQIEFTIGRACL
jgi:hypothetical protein